MQSSRAAAGPRTSDLTRRATQRYLLLFRNCATLPVPLGHFKPIGSLLKCPEPPIFQEIRLAIRSKAAKQPIGTRWENSRCRRMVKAAAARMTAQRIKPAARVADMATRIAADISNPPVTRHHHAGYPHRTKLLRVVDVAIALNRPALAKAAASSLMNIVCMT